MGASSILPYGVRGLPSPRYRTDLRRGGVAGSGASLEAVRGLSSRRTKHATVRMPVNDGTIWRLLGNGLIYPRDGSIVWIYCPPNSTFGTAGILGPGINTSTTYPASGGWVSITAPAFSEAVGVRPYHWPPSGVPAGGAVVWEDARPFFRTEPWHRIAPFPTWRSDLTSLLGATLIRPRDGSVFIITPPSAWSGVSNYGILSVDGSINVNDGATTNPAVLTVPSGAAAKGVIAYAFPAAPAAQPIGGTCSWVPA